MVLRCNLSKKPGQILGWWWWDWDMTWVRVVGQVHRVPLLLMIILIVIQNKLFVDAVGQWDKIHSTIQIKNKYAMKMVYRYFSYNDLKIRTEIKIRDQVIIMSFYYY